MTQTVKELDPFTYEVFYNRLFNLLCESRDVIRHLSASAISRESGETAEGVFLPDGELVLLSPGLLLHLNTVARVIRFMLGNRMGEDVGFEDGDQFICNDAMVASMHRMDMAVVAPFFYEGELVSWVGNYSHVPEIGATEPGGHPMIATDCYHEGLLLTPIKLVERGQVRRDLMEMMARVVRDPRPIEIDTKAKIAANERTRRNLKLLIDEVGLDFYKEACKKLIDDSEAQSREVVKTRRPGKYRARVFSDSDLPDRPGLRVMETELEVGSDGSLTLRAPVISPQAAGSYNCPLPCLEGNVFCLTLSHLFYKTRWNGGVVRIYRTDIPYGSILNCDETAAVHYGTVGVGLHASSAVSVALSRAAFVAGEHQDILVSSAPVNQLLYGGLDQFDRRCGKYVMDCVCTGGGARYGKDGADSGVHQVNPWIFCIDVEGTEAIGPLIQLGRRHVPDSGGFGAFRGGSGVSAVLTVHDTKRLTIGNMAQGRFVTPIQGMFGGYPPSASRFLKVHDADVLKASPKDIPHDVFEFLEYPSGRLEDLYCGSKYIPIQQGDLVATIYNGGGGLGDPIEREPENVLWDVRNNLTTNGTARTVNGVVLNPDRTGVHSAETENLRSRMRSGRLESGIPAAEFLSRQVERRKNRDYPAPTLALYDQLLGTGWSEAFRAQLALEERVARGDAGPESIELQDPLRLELPLTPYVNVMEDALGRRACVCASCGHVYGPGAENYKLGCLINERNPEELQGPFAPHPDWLVYREFYCPGCGVQVEVESTPSCMPILFDVELDELTQ